MTSAMGSGATAESSASRSMRTTTRSPPHTLRVGSTIRSSSVTRPASIHIRSRPREYSGSASASAASKRRPAASAAKVSVRMSEGANAASGIAGANRSGDCRLRATGWVGYNRRVFRIARNRMIASLPPSRFSRANAAWRHVATLLAAAAIALSLAGCGLLPEVQDETASYTAERIYNLAHSAMAEGNYTRAVKLFEVLETRYPYGRYAQQAIMESAYASYRAGETAAAISNADRFIRTYPNHPNVDYMYYL